MQKVAVPLASILSEQTKEYVSKALKGPLRTLVKELKVDRITEIVDSIEKIDDIKFAENEIIILLLLTGGTENLALKVSRRVKHAPIMILTSNMYNSFPAGLETLPALREEGHYTRLIYSENWKEVSGIEVEHFIEISRAILKLKNLKIGLIGGPSSWLISSVPSKINEEINLNLVRINFGELYKRYTKFNSKQRRQLYQIRNDANAIREVSDDDLDSAYKIHLALNKLMEDFKLNYVSIRCFDIIKDIKTTLCLSCFISNNSEKIVGCEGDIPSLVTMIAMSSLANAPTWMANPIRINIKANTLTLAHCTVSKKLVTEYGLRSHFESGLGIGISGVLKKNTQVTLSRIGKDFGNAIILTGKVIRSDFEDENACRTKAEIKLDQNILGFINKSIGNHIIMLLGNYKEQLLELYDTLKIKVIYC